MLGGKLVDQLGDIEGAGGEPQVAFEGQEAVDGLAAGDGVQVPAAGQRDRGCG